MIKVIALPVAHRLFDYNWRHVVTPRQFFDAEVEQFGATLGHCIYIGDRVFQPLLSLIPVQRGHPAAAS